MNAKAGENEDLYYTLPLLVGQHFAIMRAYWARQDLIINDPRKELLPFYQLHKDPAKRAKTFPVSKAEPGKLAFFLTAGILAEQLSPDSGPKGAVRPTLLPRASSGAFGSSGTYFTGSLRLILTFPSNSHPHTSGPNGEKSSTNSIQNSSRARVQSVHGLLHWKINGGPSYHLTLASFQRSMHDNWL
jgi:hypothetical protein